MIRISFEREFYQDIRDKKRSGKGIFSKKATIKGGGNQPLKTPYYFMNKKERNQLNGEEITYNLKNVMLYEDYQKLPTQNQKEVLENWVSLYSLDYICLEMNINIENLQSEMKKHSIIREREHGKRTLHSLNGTQTMDYQTAYESVMNHLHMDSKVFFDLDIKSQLIIISFINIKSGKTTTKQIFNFLQIPKIQYIRNLKSRSKYDEIFNQCKKFHQTALFIKDNEIPTGIDFIQDGIRNPFIDVGEIKEENSEENSNAIENINIQDLKIKELKSVDVTKTINTKDDILTNIDINTKEFSFKISGVQNKEFLTKKLKNIRREVKESSPNKLYKVTIQIEEIDF